MSERIPLSAETMAIAVERAAQALRQGGVVLYPTDTLYGLGADAFSNDAVDRVYAIKGRDEGKPMHCIVADLGMAGKYAEISGDARMLAEAFLPGPLTLVLKKNPGIDGGIARGMATIGIRIPRHAFSIALARRFGKPFTATSANASGAPDAFSPDGILAQLGNKAADIELVLDSGRLPASLASTVVDLSGGAPAILREGAIAAADISGALRAGARAC